MNIDNGVCDTTRIRGPGVERLPAASDASYPNLANGCLFAIIEDSSFFCGLFISKSDPIYYLSGAWPAPGAYHRHSGNSMTLGWIGAPIDHAPFRFRDAVVVFFDRSLSRTRNLAASTLLFHSVFISPMLPQHPARVCLFQVHNLFGGDSCS